ncbi:hypothetical protein [Methylobrevis pamukkalensis]|uniref:Flagellar protein FlaG n=1 Tax=Methylobrevis pamukkalensis TaxID=1439726 RepID=A0A1E3GZ74_9HYPH|nr:hypothetical protein [Methylobrevis pamukkalensis]ODN69332.1 hypothetical protein A6302_03352 [Methylobrevis pamukkalensis]
MELGIVRPLVAGVTSPAPREAPTQRTAAPTELAEQNVVTNVEETSRTGAYDERNRQPGVVAATGSGTDTASERAAPEPQVERTVVEDDRSDTLVYRKIDLQSGDVLQQLPEESLLRMRAIMQSWGEVPTAGRTAAYDLTA